MARKKRKNRPIKINNLTESILNILKSEKNKSFNYKQIAAKLGVNDASSRNQIIKTLQKLQVKQEIELVERGKYKAVITTDYYSGIIELNSKGTAYVNCEEFDEDVYIASNNINKALDGDEVELYIFKRRKRGRLEGEVTKVLKRARSEFVGIIQMKKNFSFFIPDSRKMYIDVFIPFNKTAGAKDGDKVIVQIEEWPDKADSPIGAVKKVLGTPGEHNTEIHSILAEYGLPVEFPKKVEDYANNLDTTITDKEIRRKDILTLFP